MSAFTEVFAWGGDHFGQLGQGTQSPGKTYTLPRLCSFNILIRELACGDEHTAFADSHGYVYTMGSNSEGRLGVGDRSIKQSASPCLVEGVSRVVMLDCGWGHTVAVTEDGAAYTWGMGEHGELGLGSTESHWEPKRVSIDARVITASCGARHTALICTDSQSSRSLYVFGSGEAGQLGTGGRGRELLPVRVSIGEEVKQVSCGIFQTGLVTVQGKLYMTGGNSFGQLGLGTRKSSNTLQRVTFFSSIAVAKVACGHHTAAITESGELYIWGTGVFGEVISPQKQAISAIIRDISVGGGFGAALDSSRKVWVWGSNENGELGQGDYEARASPVALAHLSSRRVRLVSCGGCSAIALGADISEGTRTQSPNTARTSSRSPYRPSSSKSPIRSGDRPLTTERGYRSPLPYQRPLDMSRVEDESFERAKIDLQRSEDHRRTEISTGRQEAYSARMRELEEILRRKDAELADAKSRIDRIKADSEDTNRSLEGQMQVLLRQTQSVSSENQRIRQELEARSSDVMRLKQSQASLIEANSKLARDHSSSQQLLEDLQRRTETEAKFKDSYIAQTSRLREDYERQLQALQTHLEEEVVLRKQVTQDLELATSHRRRLEDSLNGYQGRIESLTEEKRRLEGEGGLVEQLKEAVVALERDLDAERSENMELKGRLEASQANGKSQDMLESAVSELKYQIEAMHRQNHDQTLEIDTLRLDLRDKSEDIQRLQRENAELREAITTAELKNRELFTNFERELTTRAKDYREKTINMLNSPKSPKNMSPKPSSALRSDRYRGSPGLNLSVVSEKSPLGAMSTRRGLVEASKSPETSARAQERLSPPTFREGNAMRIGVKSSITEIREKLASLQQNKSLLEAKMRDFERKIKPGSEETD